MLMSLVGSEMCIRDRRSDSRHVVFIPSNMTDCSDFQDFEISLPSSDSTGCRCRCTRSRRTPRQDHLSQSSLTAISSPPTSRSCPATFFVCTTAARASLLHFSCLAKHRRTPSRASSRD
eukprot:TRINITY_DN61002_c0_g1_i1.p1 TRINITY_DN61002_c0_g1~~TRINITY_DN61002_c0_g1_i1.p1  ORF type:complete len:132 (-),score=18.65 TRINITY_DN61002_c0_g1_i1:104-460(-)